jgi:hypothetical protein
MKSLLTDLEQGYIESWNIPKVQNSSETSPLCIPKHHSSFHATYFLGFSIIQYVVASPQTQARLQETKTMSIGIQLKQPMLKYSIPRRRILTLDVLSKSCNRLPSFTCCDNPKEITRSLAFLSLVYEAICENVKQLKYNNNNTALIP